MSELNLQRDPHRRYNPLTSEWVLVSPHRTERPWQGQIEDAVEKSLPEYDPNCYLCPGNSRAGGQRNPQYSGTFVFENDFAALKRDTPADIYQKAGLLIAEGEPGICRVVCFSSRHDLTIAAMAVSDVRKVVDVWVDQYRELAELSFINAVQIFENRGAMMGASNPHPHGQIWASVHVPNETTKELRSFNQYHDDQQSCLLCAYLELEAREEARLVCENESFVALVPFWAVWPFETLLLSKRHTTGLDQLQESERDGLAEILKQLTTLYDALFQTTFPYTMGFHQRPTDGLEHG